LENSLDNVLGDIERLGRRMIQERS
jgi:hypothetical protein